MDGVCPWMLLNRLNSDGFPLGPQTCYVHDSYQESREFPALGLDHPKKVEQLRYVIQGSERKFEKLLQPFLIYVEKLHVK